MQSSISAEFAAGRLRLWAFVLLSSGLVLAAAFPWGDLLGHAHWGRVRWVPFVSRPLPALDIAGNLLLCVPLGASIGVLGVRRPIATAGVAAASLSLLVEAAQLFSHSRFPSTTDFVCNVAGALVVAAVIGRKRARRPVTHNLTDSRASLTITAPTTRLPHGCPSGASNRTRT